MNYCKWSLGLYFCKMLNLQLQLMMSSHTGNTVRIDHLQQRPLDLREKLQTQMQWLCTELHSASATDNPNLITAPRLPSYTTVIFYNKEKDFKLYSASAIRLQLQILRVLWRIIFLVIHIAKFEHNMENMNHVKS
jgi:hypothetical protein